MTGPRPQQFDRAAAKAAGYTDAEIDEFLGVSTRPSSATFAAESSSMQGPGKAPARAGADLDYVKGIARQVGQGATLGLADELEAGVRAPFSDRDYSQIRDDVRAGNKDFTQENPKASLAANVAGGLATGRLLPNVNVASNLTARGRIANSAVNAAAQGGAAGAASADGTAGDRVRGAVGGAALGGVAGGLFSAITDIAKRSGQVVKNVAQGDPSRGAGSAATAPRPTNRAGEQVLSLMSKAGRSLDDLTAGDEADVIAERIGPLGVRRVGSANRLGYQAPEKISETLNDRASDATPRMMREVERLTGAKARDAAAVQDEALGAVRTEMSRLYGAAAEYPPVPNESVAETIAELNQIGAGKGALRRAGELAVGRNTLTDAADSEITVQNLHNLRLGLDHEIRRAVDTGDQQMVQMLTQRRSTIDAVLKEIPEFAEADDLYAGAMQRGESFRAGEGVTRATSPDGVSRMAGDARDGEAFREGAGSAALKRLGAVQDEGVVSNPAPRLFSGDTRRAQTRAAFRTDADFDEARNTGRAISNQFETRRQVLGNSATAQRLSDDADALDDVAGSTISQGPRAAASRGITRLWDAGRRRATGGELDAIAPLLLGGGPNQMTREEVRAILAKLEPELIRQYQRRIGVTGSLTGQAAGRTSGAMNSNGR